MRRSMGWWAFAGLALAHGGGPGGLVGGLLHPFTGLDHLAAMFILMNDARLNVGVQAVAVAQGAYDAALEGQGADTTAMEETRDSSR